MALATLVLVLLVLVVGALTVSSLALAHVLSLWTVVFFYAVPGILFTLWGLSELSPASWRRVVTPLRRRFRTSRFSPRPQGRFPAAADHAPHEPAIEAVLPAWLSVMRPVLSVWRRPRLRRAVNVGLSLSTLVIAAAVGWKFSHSGWPLQRVDAELTAAACAFFLTSIALKSIGWRLLFRGFERPRALTLAGATGAASFAGLALPGRFDDALRVAIVRRVPGRRPGVGTLLLSLFLLGLIDTVALAPLAAVAAAAAPLNVAARVGLAIVAGAGVGAAVLLLSLPHVPRHRRLGRYRLSRWLGRHAPASGRDAAVAVALVVGSWLVRAAGVLVLLRALGLSLSFPLALAFLAAGSASAALPVGPAGAATQAGVGASALVAAGVDGPRAIAFAIAAQLLAAIVGGAVAAYSGLVIGMGRRRLAHA
ncbi:MAG TPA: lysylphosphatidylglycerol synthase domain-containing protein [Gaiellaceae bacterium]|nr:lysylphosphatidylglycerol synthase domain-containing protein [Gaiellaceae bacterium]